MANVEKYIFNVDAETSRATQKLQKINKLMSTIENIRWKGVDDYYTTNQKDMDKNMRSMSKLTRMYREMDRDLANIQQKMREMSDGVAIPEGATEKQKREIEELKRVMTDQAQSAIQQQRQLQSEYTKTLVAYREIASFQQNQSKNFKHVFSSNDLFNLPVDDFERAKKVMKEMASETDGVSSKLKNVKSQIQDVNKLERRSESLSRRAQASNYMSHQQASSFRKDWFTVNQQYNNDRSGNLEEMTRIGQERTKISRQIKDIEENPQATQREIDKKIALQQTVQSMDDEMEARMELNRVLNRTIKNMEEYNDRVTKDGGVEVKPERGTFRGMVYERSPAIGLALGAAAGGIFGSLYQQGAQNNRAMRDDIVHIGQSSGIDSREWRTQIRDNALDEGIANRMGLTGQDMLAFQQNYLSNRGFSGMDDLNSAMRNQAIFQRSTGVDTETTKQFFDSVFSTGAVNGSQVTDIQDAFIGAIKQSGMEGREKDQLKALQGLLDTVGRGRAMTNAEVMNVMGLQSVLASSGNRALRGEQGGQLLANLNEGIRGAFNDPMARLAFGQGTEYQGLEGRFALREQMDKGISDAENIRVIGRIAESYSNSKTGQNEAFASFVEERLGTDITAEQAGGLMDLYRQGALNDKNISGVLNQDKETGAAVGEEKLKAYQDSREATDAQSDAVTQKQATELYDLGEEVRAVNGAMGGLPPVIYATTAALVALSAAAIASAASFGGSALIRKVAGRRFRGGPGAPPTIGGSNAGGRGPGRGGPILGPDGRPLPPSGGPGGGGSGGAAGARGGIRGFFDNAKSRVGGWFGGGTAAAGGAAAAEGAAGGAAGLGSKMGGFLKGAGNILSKAALPLAIGAGVLNVATAEKGEKGKAVGESAGGILGGLGAGAAAGAALGSVIPGVGTVIGGIGGGIIGGIGGSKLGGWIGGMFDGDNKAEAAELPKEEKTVEKQLEKESTNTKAQAENKRGDNISQERENLKIYENLLNRAESLLNQARSQNGIFGSTTSGSAEGTVAATPLSGSGNAEKIWNFFSEKGFSSSAIAGIMGNLQQESGLDPTAVNPTSGAFGVGQWLGGRKTNLQNYAKETGGDMNSLETQLNFLWKELNGGDSTTKSILDKNGGLSGLKNANVSRATELFEKAFERSGGDAMAKRQQYASDFYNKYGTEQYKTNAGAAKSSSGGEVRVNSNINVRVTGDDKVSEKVKDSKDLKQVASAIQSKVYGSMGYYSQETRRV
ncbi:putative tail lysin 2 [Bacillus phage P59]|nr:putative tail lysin 2 [Bacillus phage P59]